MVSYVSKQEHSLIPILNLPPTMHIIFKKAHTIQISSSLKTTWHYQTMPNFEQFLI